ncbi:MAG: prenyltransferase/squalene oxidase repeat-containing protein [Candidatus Brocadiia bacterium]
MPVPRPITAALALLLCVGLCAPGCRVLRPAGPAERAPQPEPVAPVSPQEVEHAIRRGVDLLVRRQNPDGSWGSPRNTKGLNIYAPVPGAHHAFRAAVTSLCIGALIEVDDDRPAARRALQHGERWLVDNLTRVRRATPAALYNNWAHAYAIQALVRMLAREADPARRKRLEGLIEGQIDRLARYETVYGGWGYYDFAAHTQKPSGPPTSFTTATVLVALHEAEAEGIEPPAKLVRRAVATILRQRKPDSSYLYSGNLRWWPMAGINRPGGSLGRSQACNAALRLWGEACITDRVLAAWLDRLFARNPWLGMARKRPVPHESWFAVAGYFFYYGHYYAARCIELLPPDRRRPYQHHLARLLLGLQESDGSWWDYPFYDYHQQYGTAYALMCLARCRPEAPLPAVHAREGR